MSFAEFGALCGGFDDFHAAPDKDSDDGAPSPDDYYAAIGVTQH